MENQVANEDTAFNKEFKVMGLFIDNAKTYTQLSGAAIALSVTFVREVVGIEKGKTISFRLDSHYFLATGRAA
jgi:hypothetical protein